MIACTVYSSKVAQSASASVQTQQAHAVQGGRMGKDGAGTVVVPELLQRQWIWFIGFYTKSIIKAFCKGRGTLFYFIKKKKKGRHSNTPRRYSLACRGAGAPHIVMHSQGRTLLSNLCWCQQLCGMWYQYDVIHQKVAQQLNTAVRGWNHCLTGIC